MKKGILTLIALVIILGLGVYAYSRKAQAPESLNTLGNNPSASSQTPVPGNTTTAEKVATPSKNESGGTFSGEADVSVDGPDVMVNEVLYNGTAFSPNSINIKLGDIVVFKNNSQNNFWPASAPHPVHTDYPEFDAKKPIPPGGTFQFKFTKVGSWKYHDHLNPSAFGTINVSQ